MKLDSIVMLEGLAKGHAMLYYRRHHCDLAGNACQMIVYNDS